MDIKKVAILSLVLLSVVASTASESHAGVRRRVSSSRARSLRQSLVLSPEIKAAPPAKAQIEYFRDLLGRAESAPLEDFLRLWYPQDEVAGVDGYLLDCVDLNLNRMIRVGGELSPECRPDVMYSWGPDVKLQAIRKDFGDGVSWNKLINPVRNGVWTTISPVSTYSYGPIPIRFKFRKSVRFVNGLASDANSVGESTDGVMDFIFENGNVLESWSFGTAQHYDEIVKDIKRFMTHERVVNYSATSRRAPSLEAAIYSGVPEKGQQSEEALKANLSLMIKMILEGKGEVHYARGTPRDVNEHFRTEKPTYFNER